MQGGNAICSINDDPDPAVAVPAGSTMVYPVMVFLMGLLGVRYLRKGHLLSIFLFLVASVSLMSEPAHAAMLYFNPTDPVVEVDETVDLELWVSGLEDADLSAFDIDFAYNDSVLRFDNYALGSELGSLALEEAVDLSGGALAGGVINLREFSYLWDLSFQPDSFVLATLTFSLMYPQTTELTFLDGVLADELGQPLVTVTQDNMIMTAVPIPGAIWLFGTGLIGLAVLRRKLKN
jgi:hypothetical protein